MTPQRIQLEQEIVYAILTNPSGFLRYQRMLPPQFFCDPEMRRVMEEVHRLTDDGAEPNLVNLQASLGQHIPMPESMRYGTVDLNIASKKLAELVILERKTQLVQYLMDEDDPFRVIERVNQTTNDYAGVLALHSQPSKDAVLERYLETLEANAANKTLFVPTGIPTLDEWMHGGWKVGNMSFLGGGPGVGKTSFLLQVALNASLLDHHVTFLEGEMPMVEILGRLTGQYTSAPAWEIEAGRRMKEALTMCSKLRSMKLDLQSTFERNVQDLMAKIKVAVHEGAKLIIVDYLQVFVDKTGRAQDEFVKIKALSEAIRKMTLINNVHIIAASSLNRIDHNQKELTINSFYGGSQLGHDCNTALILTNDERQEGNTHNVRSIVLGVKKNRGGRIGDISIRYELDSQAMVEQAALELFEGQGNTFLRGT